MRKNLLLFLLFATSQIINAQTVEPEKKSSSVTLGIYTAGFTDFNGYAISAGYQYKINRYFTFEGIISHAVGNDFPNHLERQTETDPDSEAGWYSKTMIDNAAACLHFSFINNAHHYFSIYGGIGYLMTDSSDYIMSTYITHDQAGNVINKGSSYYLNVEKKNFISKNYGLQYKYTFNSGFQVGIDARGASPLGKHNFLGQDNYRAIGLLIGKRF